MPKRPRSSAAAAAAAAVGDDSKLRARARNRVHARKSRQRKKMLVTTLRTGIEDQRAEVGHLLPYFRQHVTQDVEGWKAEHGFVYAPPESMDDTPVEVDMPPMDPTAEGMTDGARMDRSRARNKLHARKSRQRKKLLMEALRSEASTLTQQVAAMRAAVARVLGANHPAVLWRPPHRPEMDDFPDSEPESPHLPPSNDGAAGAALMALATAAAAPAPATLQVQHPKRMRLTPAPQSWPQPGDSALPPAQWAPPANVRPQWTTHPPHPAQPSAPRKFVLTASSTATLPDWSHFHAAHAHALHHKPPVRATAPHSDYSGSSGLSGPGMGHQGGSATDPAAPPPVGVWGSTHRPPAPPMPASASQPSASTRGTLADLAAAGAALADSARSHAMHV